LERNKDIQPWRSLMSLGPAAGARSDEFLGVKFDETLEAVVTCEARKNRSR